MEFNKAYWRKTIKMLTLVDKMNTIPKQLGDFFDSIETLDEWKEAKIIALYSALPDELETALIVEKWSKSKNVVLPVVLDSEMDFYEYESGGAMSRGAFGILEPKYTKKVDPKSIDLVIVPGVVFDREGNRLGRGKGYYDKYLKKTNAYKIGVALNCQIIESIPHEEHDVKMDLVMCL